MDDDKSDNKKPHRPRLAGPKAEKKKTKSPHVQDLTDEQKNPKAFAINNIIRAERKFRRTQEVKSKKEHIPVVDRTPLEPPPILVAVVGPPKVGKSTLIKCLIKSYTRKPLTHIKGPVTIVSGKKRRVTFIECNNDINSMVDLAKVADLVLLLIDASFGFEMEIFEFLNISQVHGMPRIMGVLTHLDVIKHTKKLQKTKKILKRRFWTEVYPGAKLFYLSGMLNNEYMRNEIKNLARFISVMKFRPLTWQTTHPYLLADRLEDITPPEIIRQDSKADRKLCIYGYVRGIPMNKKSFIHIPGAGDFPLSDISFLPDPCPLPEQLKKRTLIERERLVYAPFSGVGGIVYDKDAVYVELPRMKSSDKEMKEMVHDLIESKETLDVKLAESQLQLFSNSKPISNKDFDEATEEVINTHRGPQSVRVESSVHPVDGRKRRKVVFNEEENSEESGIESEYEKSDNENEKSVSQNVNEESDIEEESDDHSDSDKKGRKGSLVKKKGKVSFQVEIIGGGRKEKRKSSSKGDIEEELEIERKKLKKEGTGEGESEEESASDEEEPVRRKKVRKAKNPEDNKESNKYTGVQSAKDKEMKSLISNVLADLESGEFIHDGDFSQDSSDDDNTFADKDLSIGDVPWGRKHDADLGSDDEEGGDDEEEEDKGGDDEEEVDEGSDDDFDDLPESTDTKWKENLAQKAANEFIERQKSSKNLWNLVYGDNDGTSKEEDEEGSGDEIGGLFKIVSKKQESILKTKDAMDGLDTSKFQIEHLKDWSQPEVHDLIKDCFITGKWKMEEDASELLKLDDLSEDEVMGDFEDLETGEKYESKNKEGDTKTSSKPSESSKDLSKEKLMAKKKKLKEKFDMEYDIKDEETYFDELKSEMNKQAELNRSQFEGLDDKLRVELEGFRAGMYVRLEIDSAPCELVDNFDPTFPIIAGGLQPQEQNIGYVKARIKKHRWFNRILKTRDPLIISVGWRRFQTLAVYSKQEDNMRHRMLKYTPEHVACMVHFWGPLMKSGTGFLALKNAGSKQVEPGFRIVATGTILDTNQSTVVTKKLKLIGEPIKIFKKTAFIKGMFNTVLEVAKFEGAKIKTVSGIRGQIKKALNKPEGAFRATFEDKILLSDIVFCRTWYKVNIPKFYVPITTLLLPPSERNCWLGMKTLGQLKRELGVHNEAQTDSMYSDIVRPRRVAQPLRIPRSVEENLPYKLKLKASKANRSKNVIESGLMSQIKRIVVRDEHETEVASTLNKLRATFKAKKTKEKNAKKVKRKEYKKVKEAEEFRKAQKQKIIQKGIYRTLGKLSEKPTL